MSSRRYFIKGFIGTGILTANSNWLFSSCKSPKKAIKVEAYINNSANAHRIIDQDFPEPTSEKEIDVLIIGSGISGLSAARYLSKNGIPNFEIIESESQTGGNSSYGQNAHSKYPWAAHYLPIPNLTNIDLIQFLFENKIITEFDKNEIPIYDENSLCFDPEERLFIYNRWQDGLIPAIGLESEEKSQIDRFFQEMKAFNSLKGSDGKYIFDIPISHSSSDDFGRELDKISFKQYLTNKGYTSKHLLWYLNYCNRDDYGAGIEKISAYAGIHYFASRRGKGANCDDNHHLTWPEGNGRLKELLEVYSKGKIISKSVCYKIESFKKNQNMAYVFDAGSSTSIKYKAKHIIVATPLFVTKYLLKSSLNNDQVDFIKGLSYYPWVTANITFNEIRRHIVRTLSWDNVVYNNPSLGLVYAQHQGLKQHESKKVFTYYRPFDTESAKTERYQLFNMDESDLVEIILKDSKDFYLNTDDIYSIHYRILGHGMICPELNVMKNNKLTDLSNAFVDGIYLAHSDLSGYSIFEEAFFHGNRVAKMIIENEKQ